MMNTGQIWIGLDLGEQWTNVCVLNDAGEVLAEQQCSTQFAEVETALSPFPIPQISRPKGHNGLGRRLASHCVSGHIVIGAEAREEPEVVARTR
jgi:hypothetical protein